jgi:hypothetical protein
MAIRQVCGLSYILQLSVALRPRHDTKAMLFSHKAYH